MTECADFNECGETIGGAGEPGVEQRVELPGRHGFVEAGYYDGEVSSP